MLDTVGKSIALKHVFTGSMNLVSLTRIISTFSANS